MYTSRNNLYRIVSLIAVFVLVVSACTTQSAESPVPVQVAPEVTAAPAAEAVATEAVKHLPQAIGSNDIPVPGITVINVQVSEEDLSDVDEALKQHKDTGFSSDALFVGGLLQLLLKGMEHSMCTSISDNLARHMFEDGGKRIKRLGGWGGVTAFVDAIINGRYELKAIISGFTKWRVAMLMVIDGQEYLIVLSTESASTVVPLAAMGSSIDDWLVNRASNFITVNGRGQIVEGLVYGTREIGPILQTGVYMLDTLMVAQSAVSLSKIGKCLDERVKSSEGYKKWVENGRPNTAKIDMTYESEADLVLDIQVMQDLGLVHTLVNNSEIERDGMLVLAVGGTIVFTWVIAPVIVPAGLVATEETTRYTLLLAATP